MIPILLDDTKTLETLLNDNSNGLGKLSEIIEATVTEERNGEFDLYFRIPMTAKHFKDMHNGSIVRVKASETSGPQMFRIYKISKPINGIIEVDAHHITYDLNKAAVKPFNATGIINTINGLKNNLVAEYPFDMTTTLTNATSKFKLSEPMSFRGALGGWKGSVLDIFGGEYQFDNLTVKLLNQRGYDNGVTIRYGKNLIDLRQEENIDSTYSAVIGYVTSDETTLVSDLQTATQMTYPKVKIVDFSSDYEEMPTKAQLNAKVQSYIENNDIGKPNVNLEVSFVNLAQTEEYKNIAPLERVSLCDTVTVEFPALGVSAKAKVVRTEWDVLSERYNTIELGDARSNFGQTISDTVTEKIEKTTSSWIDQAVNNATELITGGLGGYVVLSQNANGEPQEILIMDKPTKEEAINVIRMNKNGIGFSTTGYQGPFTSAWTIDGAFVADFITSGTLRAINIEGVNISGSTLRFGSNPYVQVETNALQNGVLFEGTGRVEFETNGAFYVRNNDSSNRKSNILEIYNNTTASNTDIWNYWEDVTANRLNMRATSKLNSYSIYNNKPSTTGTANSFTMTSNTTDKVNRTWLYNQLYTDTTKTANWLNVYSNESMNRFACSNYLLDGSGLANNVDMYSTSTSNLIDILNNKYNDTNVIANRLQISSGSSGNFATLSNCSSNGNTKNSLSMSSTGYVSMSNYYGTTTTLANYYDLSTSSSENKLLMRNNRTNSSTIGNSITLTAGTNDSVEIINNSTNGTLKNSITLSSNNGIVIQNNVGTTSTLSNKITFNDNGLTIENRYGGQIFCGQNEAWLQYGSRKLRFDTTSSTVSARGVQLANDAGGSNYILLRDNATMDIWADNGVIIHKVERIEFTDGTVLP